MPHASFITLFFTFQEFGLARFKTGVTKTMKGFEYVLAKMQGKLFLVLIPILFLFKFVADGNMGFPNGFKLLKKIKGTLDRLSVTHEDWSATSFSRICAHTPTLCCWSGISWRTLEL